MLVVSQASTTRLRPPKDGQRGSENGLNRGQLPKGADVSRHGHGGEGVRKPRLKYLVNLETSTLSPRFSRDPTPEGITVRAAS